MVATRAPAATRQATVNNTNNFFKPVPKMFLTQKISAGIKRPALLIHGA
jgi:hypothetical protein